MHGRVARSTPSGDAQGFAGESDSTTPEFAWETTGHRRDIEFSDCSRWMMEGHWDASWIRFAPERVLVRPPVGLAGGNFSGNLVATV